MKKLSILFFGVLLTGQVLMAQSLDEGKKQLYYGRTTSATQTFQKLIASNAKNAEAIYWLGQTHLQLNNIAEAKALYQKALTDGINDPYLWVGMGHVELLEGKKDAARQRFEAAITASTQKKKESPAILNAIGRANADGGTEVGDPMYAIEKLKRAVALEPGNSDAYVNLGINYLKLGNDHGGDAYEAFNNAIKAETTNARAKYRLGRIFQSQGNSEKYLAYFNEAVQADAAFAPAYLELYNYYALRDVNRAREFLDKYVANSDKDCNTDFFYADYLFRSGKYQESLDKAKTMASGACANYARLKVLYAYNYDRLGDSVQARANIESFMASAKPTDIQPDDYLFAASVIKDFSGGEQAAIGFLEKALSLDTNRTTRFRYMDTIAFLYKKQGKLNERLDWLRRSFQTNPNPSNLDIYNLADAALNAGQYALSDSFSRAYIVKYPTQEYGYALLARNAKAADPDSSKGTAFDEVEEYITFLRSADSVKNATKIKYQYYYIASVASDKLKDYSRAINALEKVLIIDPQDQFATRAIPVLKKALDGPKTTPARATPATKPAPAKATPAKPAAKPPVKKKS